MHLHPSATHSRSCRFCCSSNKYLTCTPVMNTRRGMCWSVETTSRDPRKSDLLAPHWVTCSSREHPTLLHREMIEEKDACKWHGVPCADYPSLPVSSTHRPAACYGEWPINCSGRWSYTAPLIVQSWLVVPLVREHSPICLLSCLVGKPPFLKIFTTKL